MSLKVSDIYNCEDCKNFRKENIDLEVHISCSCKDSQELFNKLGKLAARKCKRYNFKKSTKYNEDSEENTVNKLHQIKDGQIELESALDIILSGEAKFSLHSTKTNEDFKYNIGRAENKISSTGYIYFVRVLENDNWVYAGSIIHSEKDNAFLYKKGNNGNVEWSDIRIKSLLYVLANLYKHNYDMNLQIYKI